MMGLTKFQAECLTFIRSYLRENGIAPTIKEIRIALMLNSNEGVHRLTHGLADRGYITIIPARARGLKLIQPKDNHGADCQCAGCPGRYLQYQQIIQSLQIDPPFAVLKDTSTNFKPLSNSTRAAFLGSHSRGGRTPPRAVFPQEGAR